jgi:lysozyme
MTDRDALVAQLIRHEGCVLHAYPDSLGFLTIGIGRLIDARKGGGISHEEADDLLSHDIDSRTRALVGRFPWYHALDPVRQAVLCNMCFNLGIDGLAGFVQMLSAVERGDFLKASAAMMQSKWATQVGARAIELSTQMQTGRWS